MGSLDDYLPPPLPSSEADFLPATEAALHDLAAEGAVVLGRAGMFVLAGHPGVLRVRLDGDEKARVAQGARLEEVDERTASAHQRDRDRARDTYLRQLYGRDVHDVRLYDLVLDSTRLPLDVCTDVIVTTRRLRARALPAPRGSPAAGPRSAR